MTYRELLDNINKLPEDVLDLEVNIISGLSIIQLTKINMEFTIPRIYYISFCKDRVKNDEKCKACLNTGRVKISNTFSINCDLCKNNCNKT